MTESVTTSGSGTVTSARAGISCPGTCSATFAQGTAVTLTQSASAGSTFNGWSGDYTGSGACGFTVGTTPVSVSAAFTPQFVLTVAAAGTGSGTVSSAPAGILNCSSGGGTCSATFNSGTDVDLTPSAPAGSAFAGWSGACTG